MKLRVRLRGRGSRHGEAADASVAEGVQQGAVIELADDERVGHGV